MKAEVLIADGGLELRLRADSAYDRKAIETLRTWAKLTLGAESVLTIPIARDLSLESTNAPLAEDIEKPRGGDRR